MPVEDACGVFRSRERRAEEGKRADKALGTGDCRQCASLLLCVEEESDLEGGCRTRTGLAQGWRKVHLWTLLLRRVGVGKGGRRREKLGGAAAQAEVERTRGGCRTWGALG